MPLNRVGFKVALILEMIYPANILTGTRTQCFQPITWLVLVNKMKQQPNYNTNNLNDIQITTNLFKQKEP